MSFGKALQGLGLGMAGRGAEWAKIQQQEQLMQQQQQEQEQARRQAQQKEIQKAMAIDGRVGLYHLERGNEPAFEQLLTSRIDLIKQQGRNPSDSLALMEKWKSGDKKGVMQDLQAMEFKAVEEGLLEKREAPEPMYLKDNQISESGQAFLIKNGMPQAIDIPGYKQDEGKQKDRSLKEQQLALEKERIELAKNKPSTVLEKEKIRIENEISDSLESVTKFEVLARDFERLNVEGGLQSSFNESLKSILGSQDAVTDLRTKFNQVRMSQGLKFLPPGPATDKDVEMAMKGVPPENAPASQVASFLRGVAKIEKGRAAYNQFRNDFISKHNSTSGVSKNWRKKMTSPHIKQKFTIGDIYLTAMTEDKTPEEVAKLLGVELP